MAGLVATRLPACAQHHVQMTWVVFVCTLYVCVTISSFRSKYPIMWFKIGAAKGLVNGQWSHCGNVASPFTTVSLQWIPKWWIYHSPRWITTEKNIPGWLITCDHHGDGDVVYSSNTFQATDHCTVGSQADIQLFWAIGEFIYGLLELVAAQSSDLKTVFRLNFKQV